MSHSVGMDPATGTAFGTQSGNDTTGLTFMCYRAATPCELESEWAAAVRTRDNHSAPAWYSGLILATPCTRGSGNCDQAGRLRIHRTCQFELRAKPCSQPFHQTVIGGSVWRVCNVWWIWVISEEGAQCVTQPSALISASISASRRACVHAGVILHLVTQGCVDRLRARHGSPWSFPVTAAVQLCFLSIHILNIYFIIYIYNF